MTQMKPNQTNKEKELKQQKPPQAKKGELK